MRAADLHEPDVPTAAFESCRSNLVDTDDKFLAELGVAKSGEVEH